MKFNREKLKKIVILTGLAATLSKGRQQPPEGGHANQERGTMGAKTLWKAGTPSKKEYKASQKPREGGHTIQEVVQRD